MKKTTRTARKVLSVFLAVLMMLTTWAVAVPDFAQAADTYYVRVYLNIYDGANSDGYGNPYTVVTDPSSEFYGKPDDYKWDYGSSWSATDNSKGYDGEINMAGFTLFYDNDKKYETYDLSADLVAATTTLGNNFTSMDNLTLQNFSQAQYKVEKIYGFTLDSMPSSLFWINDENNAVNGETGFGIHKITVAESSTGQEHTLWSGLSGSESYYECYYGTITPTGLITPWDDCPDAQTYTFYKDYTTSAVGTWIDPFNAGEYNVYPVNNYLSGGVSASFTVGNSGSQTNIDYVDVGNTNNYYINFTNHSTQGSTITLFKAENKSLLNGYYDNYPIPSGKTVSFALNKASMGGDGTYTDFSFKFKLDNVYNSDGTTQSDFYQAAGIGTWNTTDDLKAIGLPEGESSNAGFTLRATDIDVMNRFMVDKGILESSYLSGNRTTPITFTYNYWLDNSEGMSNWSETGLRMYAQKWGNYRLHFQPDAQGTMAIEGAIANSDASLSIADLVTSYTSAADTFTPPNPSDRPWAYVGSPCKPQWDGTTSLKWGTLWDSGDFGYFRFCGNLFQGSTTTSDPAKITFSNMTWVCPALWSGGSSSSASFSGTINVYVFDKTDLRNYVRSLGGLGANWAPMRTRFNDAQWNAYEIALKTAKEVLANQKTNQKAVTDAYNALYSATEALKATSSLKSQVAEVTYTQRTTDYDSAATETTKKYLIMPIGTETAVPAYDTYKYATNDTVVGKQSSNLKTNYTQYDTGINPIDYRYWKIDFAGVDEALTKATNLLNTPLDTYSDSYYEKLQDARTALSAFDRDADTWTPTHQSDIDDALAALNELLAHDSTDAAKHQFIKDDKGNYVVKFDDTTHWYECEVCGYKYMHENHTTSATPDEGGNTHTVACTYTDDNGNECEFALTEAHTYNKSTELTSRPIQNADGTWTDGTYTYTCICGATKTESTERADYTELDKAVEALEELNKNENLTDDAKTELAEALEKAENLADNLVTAEQSQVDALVKELQNAKADIEEAISEVIGTSSVTEATSGVKVQFLKATGVEAVEYVQLDADGSFDSVRMRLTNGNKDLPVTVTSVTADKAAIGFAEAFTLDENGGSKDLVISDTDTFNDAGIITYTITYTIDGLKNADGTAVTATTKAYLYVKAAAFTPYHLMDETCNNGPATAKWEYSLESSVGDFAPVYNNKAPKAEFGNDNLVVDKDWVRPVYHKYDYEDNNCFAECTGTGDTPYVKGDAHAATYRYYIDTSLAPTWQDAGFKAVIAEGVESKYDYAVFDYIRLANNKAYLDSIQGDDKTFSVTVIPGASSNVPTKTWTATSTGNYALTVFDTSDVKDFFKDTEYLFGNYLDEAQTIYTAYTNFSGSIPQRTENANMMFSYRIGYNMAEDHFLGGVQAESTTMTTHLRITSYDKAALREAVANAETAGYNSAYFDAEKYAAYEEALANAKEVLGKAETNQTEVDEATEALNNAIADLAKAESETKFVLTVTHSIHENADKDSEATGAEYDYYLVAKNGTVTPALKSNIINLEKINKYDDTATIIVDSDKTYTYHYWYIDYSGVQDAIDAADDIIDDTENGYSEEYKQKAEDAKDALQDIFDDKDSTTTPESQADVNNAIGAVTALTGHTCDEAVEISAVAPTCKEAGLKAGARCSVCGKITKAQEIDPKLPHTEEIIPAVPATCTATGLTEGKKCSACGEILVAQEVTPMADHTPGEAVVENNKSATCTAEGSYDNVTYCTKCGTQTSRETIIVDKADHSYGDGVVTAPTCTAGGYTTYTCTACGHSYTDNETSAINHSWSVSYEWADDYSTCTATRVCANDAKHNVTAEATVTSEVTDEPTCEGKGTTTYTAVFEADWASMQTEEKTIPAINHDYDIENAELVARPELIDGEWTDGKYEATCRNDTSHKLPLEGVQRADYTAFDEAVAKLKELATYENFTDAIKAEILKMATELENGTYDPDGDGTPNVPLNYVADYTYNGVTIPGEQATLNALITDLDAFVANIENNKTNEKFIKPDYTEIIAEWEEYLTLVEQYGGEVEYATEGDSLSATVTNDGYIKDATNTSVTNGFDYILDNAYNSDSATAADWKDKIAEKTAELAAINEGIIDGTLRDPNFEAYDTEVKTYNEETSTVNISADDKATVEAAMAIVDAIKANPDATAADSDATIATQTAIIKAINEKYAACKKDGHKFGAEEIATYPVYDEVSDTWSQGTYTKTCEVCGYVKTVAYDRANYEAYDKAVADLNSLLANENITAEAKAEINKVLTDNAIRYDLMTPDQSIVDAAVAKFVAEYNKLTDENGNLKDEYKKPDYTEWDKAETAYDTLDKTNVKPEIIVEADGLKSTIADKQADKTLTQATATQEQINAATDRLNEIVAGINDGTLVKPDYSGAEEAIEDAKEVADSENIPDDTEAEIEAEIAELEEQLNEIKDSNPSSTDEEVNNKIAEIEQAAKDIIDTYGECAKGNHTDVETDGDHNCDVCGKLDVTSHNYVNPQLTRPVYDEEKGEWSDGYYTSTCNCGDTSETTIARADYEAYDKAVADLNALLETGKLTQTAVDMINAALEANDILDDYVATSEEQDIVDDAAAALKVTLGELTDENGLKKEYKKVDYSKYDAAVNAYENLKNTMTDADEAAVEAIKAEIAEIPADASAKDYQTQVDKAAEDIAKINAKYGDCASGNHTWGEPVLTKKPTADAKGEYTETCTVCGATQITEVERADYDAFDDVVKALEDLAKTENLTDEAKQAIENALAKAEELDKNLPADVTTVDGEEIKGGQDEIDALVAELNKVVTDTNAAIADGSALKPDYNAWEEAETAYDTLDKTNVKPEIIVEADGLKATIADKQADKTLTQATATQAEINAATGRLNEIIAGINDGSLKDPDYSAVEEKLTEANNATGLNKDTQDKIDAIEKELQKIKDKEEPEANYRDNQGEVDALEDQLDEILDSIADGTAKAPDYTQWDAAEGTYDALDKTNVPAELITEATNLKATIDALKADDTANATEDQKTVDDATTRLNEIIDAINGILTEKPDFSGYDGSHDTYEELVEQYGDKIKDGVADDVADLDTIVDGVRNDETSTKIEDQDTIDDAKKDLDAIINGIKDGSLRDPDYSKVEDKITEAKGNDDLNKDTQDKIKDIEDKLQEIKDKTEPEANAKDDQPAVDALESQLNEILDSIADGTAKAPNYAEWDAAEDIYDALDKTNVPAELITEATNLKATIDALKADDTANATEDQKTVDDATTRLNEIIDEINGILTEKPDFTDYDDSHDTYEELVVQYGDKIKDGVADDVADLDTIVDGVRNDETATKIEDQPTVDNAKTELDKIIEGIEDGSLRDPDYSKVEDKITEAKGNDDLNKDTQDKIKDIEDKLQEIKDKTEPEANAKYDQPAVDALESQLNEILDSIADGTAKAPNYSEWDAAEGTYDALDKTNVPAELITEATNLKATIDALKADDTANATEDQKTVDAATTRLNEIIDAINGILTEKPDFSGYDGSHDTYEELVEQYGDKIKDGVADDIADLDTIVEGVRDDETATKIEDQPTVDNAKTELDAIINGIKDGSLLDPDYTEAEKAIEEAKKIDDLSDEDKKALEDLEKQLDDLQKDPTTNKKDDQTKVDSIKNAAQEIIEKYAVCNHTDCAVKVVKPTCHSVGYTLYTCRECGYSYRTDEILPTNEHVWVWSEVEAVSCKEARKERGRCVNDGCTATMVRTVTENGKPVMGSHVLIVIEGTPATCTIQGHSDYTRCVVCGEISESTVIPAKGHVDGNGNGNCDVCNFVMNPTTGKCGCLCHSDSFFGKLIFRILNFFWKLFKIQQGCQCGAQHW